MTYDSVCLLLRLVAPLMLATVPLAHGADKPPRSIRVTGTVQAVHSATIQVPAVEGQGANLTLAKLVQNGASVRQGELLAEFDRTDLLKLARDLALKNVAAEQQKYELGTITAFEVLDSQTRLASSESALLGTYVSYQQAYIEYERATWTLLDGLGIVVETPHVR